MASEFDLSFDRGTLLLRLANGGPVPTMLLPDEWTWDARVGAWRTQAFHYSRMRSALAEWCDGRVADHVPPPQRIAWPAVALPPLRSEQSAAVAAWEQANCRGVIVMPTGAGKSEVALSAMARSRVATLIVAPVRDLMHQWHQRILRRLGYDAGIIGDSLFNLQPVTVTTYDSAYIHMSEIGDRFGLIIFDEAHHLPGRCYREASLFCAAPMRMGLTATPERSDGRERDLDQLIGPVVFRQHLAEAKGRTLADYDVVRIPVHLSEQEQTRYEQASRAVRSYIAKRRADLAKEAAAADSRQPAASPARILYTWEDLCSEAGSDPEARRVLRAYHVKKSIEDRAVEKIRVLEDLFRLHAGERVLVFAGSNAMAMDVSRRFLVPTLLNHSRKTERREVLEGFAGGRFPVLVANQVLDEGVDVPEAKVAVVIGGQASTRQAKQRLGRILRKTGPQRATLYEIVCEDTKDVERSRSRRRSDAYDRVRRSRRDPGPC